MHSLAALFQTDRETLLCRIKGMLYLPPRASPNVHTAFLKCTSLYEDK